MVFCLGGESSGWELSWWELSRWELSSGELSQNPWFDLLKFALTHHECLYCLAELLPLPRAGGDGEEVGQTQVDRDPGQVGAGSWRRTMGGGRGCEGGLERNKFDCIFKWSL